MNETLWAVVEALRRSLGLAITSPSARATSGGCINKTTILTDSDTGGRWFVKIHAADRLDAFRAEQAGLDALQASATIRVPEPLLVGSHRKSAFLVMEAIAMESPPDRSAAERRLGEQLATLHRVKTDRFGWHRNNRIGDTLQLNTWEDDWVTFFRKHRLGMQWQWAEEKGLTLSAMPILLEALPVFFNDYTPKPSLLHGDLWSGNVSYDANSQPVIFDPAVYHGDRETDLAFTEMFGGFGPAFYQAYDASYPRDVGHFKRRDLYNLYHLLNHFNLFGGSYGQNAQSVAQSLIRGL